MQVLIVTATRAEVDPLLASLCDLAENGRIISGRRGVHVVDVLVTGVGMVATAVWCSRVLASARYDVAINLGLCGAFGTDYPLRSVVHVTRDSVPELGAEDGARFLPVAALRLPEPPHVPFASEIVNHLPPPLPGLAALPIVSGITVNTVHGEEQSIAAVMQRCAPDVESMEGAAFMYACQVAGVPFAQVRAVSNRVERRNRAAWDLRGAVNALGEVSHSLLADTPAAITRAR